jgi:hypothetical protein
MSMASRRKSSFDGVEDGSGLAAVVEDAVVVISIALQHCIAAAELRGPHARDD